MTPPALAQLEAEFDIFWEAYPLKKGKTDAERHWHRVKPTLSEVMAALEIQKQEKIWLDQHKKFVPEWPYGSTWVNQQRWRDGYHPDFEAYLKYEKERPARLKRELEAGRQRIRDEYQDWLEGKSTQALKDLKNDGGHVAVICGWLITEILAERKVTDEAK